SETGLPLLASVANEVVSKTPHSRRVENSSRAMQHAAQSQFLILNMIVILNSETLIRFIPFNTDY
ncbi:TPA: hypothetical protein RY308_002073, partial [Yersinia enterocolitica]|nr:hypothetical protein [Yersinia enterocolitica]